MKGQSAMQVTALVLGIVSLVLSIIPLVGCIACLVAIPGIVFSGIGMAKAKKPEDKKGFAIAGLVMGIIALLISFGQCADTDDTLKELDKSIKELQSS